MRPFKMFFGIAIGVMFFFFLARVVFVAFIAAAIMSIIYAIYRRAKDFITYDRYGDYYIKEHRHSPRINHNWSNEIEPLFQESTPMRHTANNNIRFIEAI